MTERKRLLQTLEQEASHARDGGAGHLGEILALLDPVTLTEALTELPEEDRLTIFDALDIEMQADVLAEADEPLQDFFVDRLQHDARFPEILEEIDPDDAADLLDDMTDSERAEVLENVEAETAQQLRDLSRYDSETAGGLMTPEFLAVEETTTIREVKQAIRATEDIESIENIFVVRDRRLLGVFSVRELLLAEDQQECVEVATMDVRSVEVDADREQVYRVMEDYNLISLPVVDDFHNLVGLITVDDVLTIGEEEASEDVFRIAGSSDLHPTRDSIRGRVTKRLPYLAFSVGGGLLTAVIMKSFEFGSGTEIPAFMFFLPMIMMLGGNIAQQSSATMVRGFATGEVELSRLPRILRDEIMVGVAVGISCALLGCSIAWFLAHDDPWGVVRVVMCAIITLSAISATLGTVIPAAFHRFAIDPAIAAGPMITMLIDMIGTCVYFAFVLVLGVRV